MWKILPFMASYSSVTKALLSIGENSAPLLATHRMLKQLRVRSLQATSLKALLWSEKMELKSQIRLSSIFNFSLSGWSSADREMPQVRIECFFWRRTLYDAF